MVKLQLVIDYIRTLEEAVDSLCNQLDVNVTSDYSFITKSSSSKFFFIENNFFFYFFIEINFFADYSKKTSKKVNLSNISE